MGSVMAISKKGWFLPQFLSGIVPTKWSNTLKQFVGNLPTNCLKVFDHFVKLTLKGLRSQKIRKFQQNS